MNKRTDILSEFQKQPENTLIITGKLYREKFSDQFSEMAFTQSICRLCKAGEISRVSKGIYCRPKRTRFGNILPSDKDIIRFFTENEKGVVVGYPLYNLLGVSTQVSKHITAFSSIAEEKLKQIGNITIHKYDLDYTMETKAMIQLMEMLYQRENIQDINYPAFLKSTEQLSGSYNDNVFESIQKTIGYPKWTIASLREVLNYYQVPNRLDRYLSALSEYHVPKMEELYEAACQSI